MKLSIARAIAIFLIFCFFFLGVFLFEDKVNAEDLPPCVGYWQQGPFMYHYHDIDNDGECDYVGQYIYIDGKLKLLAKFSCDYMDRLLTDKNFDFEITEL